MKILPLLFFVVLFIWGGGSSDPPPNKGPALLLDVSSHQGSIDWQKVKDFGVRGVYHKLSEGEDFLDPAWSAKRKSAIRDAGILYGFYHFVRPRKRPAYKEARWFARQARAAGGWGQLLPALDIEVTELGPRATGNYLADLIRSLRSQGVSRITLYSSPGWWKSNVALTPKLKRNLRWVRPWIAHWGVARPDPLRGKRGWVLHQYTATGRVPGIRGNVDMNKTTDINRLLR